MEIVFTVLILLVAVSASGILVRLLPFPLPLPLVQIAAGALLALPLFKLHFSFDPELFLLLFIPPLLFADGWRTPKREFFLHRRAILLLALGLVLFTVAGVGYFVHWMVPALPLPMAFALAAVLSPTDAVALGAIAGPRRIPRQLMHILEGEALMNDASGLVALKFAIAAALTGSFSMWSATGSFLLIALGGLATGIAMAWMFAMGSRRFAALAGQDSSSQVLLVFLLPFAAYLFAEHFGLSGILSAVAAGMTMNYVDLLSPGSLTTRLQTVSAWETLQYVFNGMVFI
ncbi:MAG: cation:proton antiporter, partial [Janthinobacterium lividum]